MSWGLIGHRWAEALLKRHITQSTVRHAYLFTGAPGIGKRTLALRFAQALNCRNSGGSGELCGRDDCRACSLIPSASYPDLHLVLPNGSIKIEQIRELQSTLSLAPYEGLWRVALLTQAHLATEEAANALLKLLEEPPPKVVLVLTSPDSEALPLTVVSRCELLQLHSVEKATIAAALQADGVEAEQAKLLAAVSGGRPGVALALAEDPRRLEQRIEALAELNQLLHTPRVQRIAEVQRLVGSGNLAVQRQRVAALLDHWLGLWRDLVNDGFGSQVDPLNPDLMGEFASAAKAVPSAARAEGLSAVVQAQQRVQDNANLRLALEQLMLAMPELGPEAEPRRN